MSLKSSAKQAILWSGGLSIFRDGVQFLQMLVLVRLLDPAMYGMAGYAYVVINFIGLISFQHVVTHVVQVRSNDAVDYQQHFTFGILLNGGLFVLTNGLAFASCYIGQYAELQPILHVLSLTFLLSVPVDLRQKMLEREHRWQRLRPLQMAMMVVSVVVGVGMALAGAGVYALIVPGLVAGLVFVVDLFLVARWRPRWSWNWGSYRDALSFGLNRAVSNGLNGGRKLLESSLITEHFQFSSLGVFGRAEGLANLFCGRVAQQVLGALYPVITRADPASDRFRRIAGLVLRSVAWVIIPAAVLLAMEADRLTTLLYGEKWQSVVQLLPLAMAVGAAQGLGASAYQLLLANEERRLCLRSDTAAFLIGSGTMLALIPQGVLPYLAGAVAANSLIAFILLALLVRTRGLALRSVWTALLPTAVASCLAATAIAALHMLVPPGIPSILYLILAGAIFVATYALALRLLFRSSLVDLLEYVPGGQVMAKVLRTG
jgi:O-antigen/teichoic acid export membrane protein